MSTDNTNFGHNCNIMITIEEQLEQYTRCSNSTRRHQILWHAWKHNKEWLSKLLQWTLPSFPAYSMHDASHAESVLHNIEMMMGESIIRSLSASNCFLILHMAYIHDIGMCITSKYRKSLLKSDDFQRFLKECENKPELKRYAKVLLDELGELEKQKSAGKEIDDRDIKLEIYYAILYLVADYRRSSHGDETNRMLIDWIEDKDKLGSGFSTSGIPIRFFYTIGTCAGIHNSSKFSDIMALPREDGGYAYDYMHPRLATVLLQLGDCLDLDNDRFHPLYNEFLHDIPNTSQTHFRKHKSIRRLRISPRKISIHADCEKISELRLVRMEYEGIQNILKEAAYNWAAICPDEIDMVLPFLEPLQLMLHHRQVNDPDLTNLHFYIQQDKAFNLLQGSNIYKDRNLVFLREILQNAIDATKIQYWKEWMGSHWRKEKLKNDFATHISPKNYPIVICLHLGGKIAESEETIFINSEEDLRKCQNSTNCEYGVVVRIRDYGTGISGKSLHEIAEVGSTLQYALDEKSLKEMPQWLRPTAAFGVGLQSAFLVTDSFFALTHVRDGEKYRIEFNNNARNNGNGYINVSITDDNEEGTHSYGTRFEIFVPSTAELHYSGDLSALGNIDPFRIHYKTPKDNASKKELDKCRYMIMQMFCYINDLIVERLFPIKIRIYDYETTLDMYDGLFSFGEAQIIPEIYRNSERVQTFGDKVDQSVTWTYGLKDYTNTDILEIFDELEQCDYAVDIEHSKFYVADKEHNLYACLSSKRFISQRMHLREPDDKKIENYTRIYYKGIYVKDMFFGMDMDMLEYIDIKQTLDIKYLALNRSEFTKAGEEYIKDTIYPQILTIVRSSISHYGKNLCSYDPKKDIYDESRLNEIWDSTYFDASIDKKTKSRGYDKPRTKEIFNQPDHYNRIHYKVLFWAGLGALLNTGKYTSYHNTPVRVNSVENVAWLTILNKLSDRVEDCKHKAKETENIDKYPWTSSTLYNLFYDDLPLNDFPLSPTKGDKSVNIIKLLQEADRFIILSHRKANNSTWEESLFRFPKDALENVIGEDGHSILKENILKLKTEWNAAIRNELIEAIENGLECIYSKIGDDDIKGIPANADGFKQNLILTWILNNVPSIAVYSNKENTKRINVLDTEHTDSIYLCKRLRAITYQRMAYQHQTNHIQRFSTIATTSFCQLGIKEMDDGIHYLKRGKVGKHELNHIIIPLSGEDIKKYYSWLQEGDPKKEGNFEFLSTDEQEYILRYFALPLKNVENGEGSDNDKKETKIQRINPNDLTEILKEDSTMWKIKEIKSNLLKYVGERCLDKRIAGETAEQMYFVYIMEMLDCMRLFLSPLPQEQDTPS